MKMLGIKNMLFFKSPVVWILFVPLAALFISSCQQVVTIDLNKTSPHVVIEGVISDLSGPYKIRLTKSGNYFEPTLFLPPITNGHVFVTDNFGMVDTLKQDTIPGTYSSSTLQGAVGKTYYLKVSTDGKEFTATSSIPTKVLIDSLYAVKGKMGFDNTPRYSIYILFHDPPGEKNYYRLNVQSSTNIPSDSIDGRRYRLYTDKLADGFPLLERVRTSRNVNPGDTITIQLLSIDKQTYDYYSTLRNILSSDRSPTSLSPANPNNNLSNNALGYFAAMAIDTKRIIMP